MGQALCRDTELKCLDGIFPVFADTSALAAPESIPFSCEVVQIAELQDERFCWQPCYSVMTLEEKLLAMLLSFTCSLSFMLSENSVLNLLAVGKMWGEASRQWKSLRVSTPSCVQNANKEHFPWDSLWRVWGEVEPTHLHIFWFVSLNGKKNLWNLAHRTVINRFVEIRFCCKYSVLGSVEESDTVSWQMMGKESFCSKTMFSCTGTSLVCTGQHSSSTYVGIQGAWLTVHP